MSLSNLITLIGSNITAAVAGVKRGRISNKSNADFLHKVGRYSFWKNTADTSVAQIYTYNHVHDFLDSCEIKNGNAVTQNGRRRKVLFIGFDGMRDHILSRIDAGDSVVCGIFHNIDTAGHMYGFGSTQYNGAVISCDMYAYSVLRAVQEREKTFNEQWLVVFANDHGGLGKGHGNQTLEERTAWLATNIDLNEKYYAHGYNGFSCI